jgi:hypothetical protein
LQSNRTHEAITSDANGAIDCACRPSASIPRRFYFVAPIQFRNGVARTGRLSLLDAFDEDQIESCAQTARSAASLKRLLSCYVRSGPYRDLEPGKAAARNGQGRLTLFDSLQFSNLTRVPLCESAQ